MATTKMSPAKIHSYIISIKNTRNRHILAILDYNFSTSAEKKTIFDSKFIFFSKFKIVEFSKFYAITLIGHYPLSNDSIIRPSDNLGSKLKFLDPKFSKSKIGYFSRPFCD